MNKLRSISLVIILISSFLILLGSMLKIYGNSLSQMVLIFGLLMFIIGWPTLILSLVKRSKSPTT
jgi:hypothetical protein